MMVGNEKFVFLNSKNKKFLKIQLAMGNRLPIYIIVTMTENFYEKLHATCINLRYIGQNK